ncbi:MAG TPA: universal stress protein [Oscillatoriaceae cyanobacterium]
MKALHHPRAVVYAPDAPSLEPMLRALARLGIEGYAAPTLESVSERALRMDTLMVVVAVREHEQDAALATIADVRRAPKSKDVLIAALAQNGLGEKALAAGANVAQSGPLTLALAYTLLLRLARRPRLEDTATPPTAQTPDDPHEVLRRRVDRHMASLKIYLGASPGVGKTYAMLREGHELRNRGEDVVVGLIETHGRRETAEVVDGLEVQPRLDVPYKGVTLDEMDLDGLLTRNPAIALVDELAHTHAPGSLNKKRDEDVNVLRLAGIPVISTLNIQHLESLNDIVERITGIKVRETIPDTMLEEAEEVVLVDLSPEALQKRLQAGKIYAPEKITQSLSNFFTTHNLTALRELVLRELADKVDETLEEVRASIGKPAGPTGIQDRLLACITTAPDAQRIIRRGARLAARLSAELLVLHVETHSPSAAEERSLAASIELAESLEAEVVRLKHDDAAEAIARYATENKCTMILLGETHRPRVSLVFKKSIFELILDKTSNIDLVTVATHVV